MSDNLAKCFPILEFAAKIRDPKKRAIVVSQFDKCAISALHEICINVTSGRVKLEQKQLKRLKKYKWAIRGLASPYKSVSLRGKKQLIAQKGGSLLSVLIPIVASIITSFLTQQHGAN